MSRPISPPPPLEALPLIEDITSATPIKGIASAPEPKRKYHGRKNGTSESSGAISSQHTHLIAPSQPPMEGMQDEGSEEVSLEEEEFMLKPRKSKKRTPRELKNLRW